MVEVAVKYPRFAPIYESMSFGRVAPEENFGGFILSFNDFYAWGVRGGQPPAKKKIDFRGSRTSF